MAIRNARLFAETERRERETSALYDVTRRLTAASIFLRRLEITGRVGP